MSSITLNDLVKSGTKLTPMMAQYYEIKQNYQEHIVLFRMGDFYEVFFEDAKELSKILNIALTHRGKLGETPVPMAGIPHHAATNYIDRLTQAGKRVAICEQVQDPKDAVGIVKRAVTQVVSPGLPFCLNQAKREDNYFLASSILEGDVIYLVMLDYSTGQFIGWKLDSTLEMSDILSQWKPKEFLCHPGQWARFPELEKSLQDLNILKNLISSEFFEENFKHPLIEKFVPNFKNDLIIKENSPILRPINALASFIHNTQGHTEFHHLSPLKIIERTDHLQVSAATLTGLEILPKTFQDRSSSLLGFCDKTMTAMGARALRDVFLHPLICPKKIDQRHQALSSLLDNIPLLKEIRENLQNVRDTERILSKLSSGRAIPQDLVNLSNSILASKAIEEDLLQKDIPLTSKDVSAAIAKLYPFCEKIKSTINDDPRASIEKRNLIVAGIHEERDRLWELSENSEQAFIELEEKYLKLTNIPKIKIKSNNIHGHFIEISKLHSDKVPDFFNRKQTLVNSERYTTPELTQLEQEALIAREKVQQLERQILDECISTAIDLSEQLKVLNQFISTVDINQSFAFIAHLYSWTKPKIMTSGRKFSMKGAWHPLIKKMIGESFVPHALNLNEKTFFGLITGPNMAGKTTVMREVAIIQLLSQVGSYVPAEEVELSLCDRIFSRLGASDNIQQGQSTFMVEMSETAEIIRHATKKSLVILDEIGRGTSTYDGLSIAWSLVNYFLESIKCRCLFATHYHELIELVDKSKNGKNLTVETQGSGQDIKFLYRLIEGGASQSYGIFVAKLAGIPDSILHEAQNILHRLEQNEQKTVNDPQLSILDFCEYSSAPSIQTDPKHLEIIEELKKINLLNSSPFDNLKKIEKLQNKLI